ncbi:MAG: DNA internalization-related competence protein ComEC/Rec2 [Acidobacteria bacterium]|nr:DNA internalization-related competence protein ComEC/Rec2 [Acidobacteriota bacterium]
MFRPFAVLALVFSSGILFQYLFPIPVLFIIFAALIFIVISIIYTRKDKIITAYILLGIAMTFLGMLHYQNHQTIFSDNDFRELLRSGAINSENQYTIIAQTISPPTFFENNANIEIDLKQISSSKVNIKSSGKLFMSISLEAESNSQTLPERGDTIRVIASFKLYKEYDNGNYYKHWDYRSRKNLEYSIKVKDTRAIQILKKRSLINPINLANVLRKKVLSAIDSNFNDLKIAGFYKAVLLGVRDKELFNENYNLRTSGLYHITAVSGIHIGILLLVFMTVFRYIYKSRNKRLIASLVSLIIFWFAIGFYPSVTRATIISAIWLLALLAGRKIDFINVLGLSAFIILLANPNELFGPGFHYTYLISLFLYLFLNRILQGEKENQFKDYFLGLLVASVIAFLVSTPLNAYHYNMVTPVSIIINLLVAPLLAILLSFAFIFIIFSILEFPFVGLLAVVQSLIIKAFQFLVGLGKYSWASFRVPTPNIFLVTLSIILLLLLYLIWSKPKPRLVLAASFSFALMLVIFQPFSYSPPDELRIHFLDVGRGDSIFIETPSGQNMLVDGGGSNSINDYIGERIVSRYLWNLGIKKIDYMILTHAHDDHTGGLWPVARNFKIGEFWENGLNSFTMVNYNLLIYYTKSQCETMIVREGFQRKIGNLEIFCLNPPVSSEKPAMPQNNDSIVIRMLYGNSSVLLTGDIEKKTEKRLIEKYGNSMESDILKAPHHGSKHSNTQEFIEIIDPQIVIFTARNLGFIKFPNPTVLKLYNDNGADILRTDKNGRILLKITLSGKISYETIKK